MNNDPQKILEWYKRNARSLPWRKPDASAYHVWVSEIMLQQTQVSRVVLYYERFLKKFPNVQKLSRASWEEFLPFYEGLGYYARGRNMLAAAQIIVREYAGEFPRTKSELLKLPGIGEYTASAILSFAYSAPEIAFDTNFRKVFKTREKAETAFKKSGVSSAVFNSAVMDYASAHREVKGRKFGKLVRSEVSNIALVLHENHKKYFSSCETRYEAFLLPDNVCTREQIKKYFLEKYGLRLSVRPPKGSALIRGKERTLVNAQILSGEPIFSIFKKSAVSFDFLSGTE
ncbi:MAG: hypothetical protein HYT94_04300 [Parcubacteria group bacterium]|nr:hypothetical protein [Parcubacteria group bacterium]